MASSNHRSGEKYTMYVQYEWIGSPAKDFTLKVYSKFKNSKVKDNLGETNMINMDG